MLAGAGLLSGCRVDTSVAVVVTARGSGVVTVTVAFDRSALGALGGLAALKSDLSVGDLVRAGWKLTGPVPAAGGGAMVSVAHAFASPAQVAPLMAEIAGPSVFQVSLVGQKGFWRDRYLLTGRVDLSCGVDCFGDAGLGKLTGSNIGVPEPSAASGVPELTFSLSAVLPGKVVKTDAPGAPLAPALLGSTGPPGPQVPPALPGATARPASGPAGGLRLVWPVLLGGQVTVDATSQVGSDQPRRVLEEAGAGGAVLLAATGAVVIARRRRRRRWLHRRGRAGAGTAPAAAEPGFRSPSGAGSGSGLAPAGGSGSEPEPVAGSGSGLAPASGGCSTGSASPVGAVVPRSRFRFRVARPGGRRRRRGAHWRRRT